MNQNAYVTEMISSEEELINQEELSATDFRFLKKLSDADLLSSFGKVVKTERKITHIVLEYIVEINLRELHLERGFPSLCEFLVEVHGYTRSAALRRIDSAKLLQEIPEIAQQIQAGALNLSQISMASKGLRQAQKISPEKLEITVEQKKELLSKIEYSTQQQTEIIIAQEFNLPITREEKRIFHQDGSMTLTTHFSKEEVVQTEQLLDLAAHSIPDRKWSKLFSYLVEKELNQRTKIKRPSKVIPEFEIETASYSNQSILPIRKPIKPNIKKFILGKDQCCQYKDPLTKKVCGSRRFLQVDHIQPIFAGGTNNPSNLRILCAQHNQFRYRKEISEVRPNP